MLKVPISEPKRQYTCSHVLPQTPPPYPESSVPPPRKCVLSARNNANVILLGPNSTCNQHIMQRKILLDWYLQGLARFFITGEEGIFASAEGTSLVRGSKGILPQSLRNAIFYPRILLATRLVPGCAITGTLCKLEWTMQIVHIHANFNRGFCFLF